MSAGSWRRVSGHARCPICARPDWCLVSRDGGAAICARVESSRRAGEAGYLHRLGAARQMLPRPEYHRPRPAANTCDLTRIMELARAAVCGTALVRLAAELGVDRGALWRLGIGQRGDEWLFPMYNADGAIVGIRRRLACGKKLSIAGGREGLFIPADLGDCNPLLVCEGATDTAAALSIGFDAIGRPSCSGAVRPTCLWCVKHDVRRAVLAADADAPGRRGAADLARELVRYVADIRIIVPSPPHKDLRGWYCAGATCADVARLIELAEPVRREGAHHAI